MYSRFLLGDSVSEADVRLFPTIFRFDHIYYLRFLLDRAMISESYPNLQVSHHSSPCDHVINSSFQSQNVYSNSKTPSLHWKSKLRNAWGQ